MTSRPAGDASRHHLTGQLDVLRAARDATEPDWHGLCRSFRELACRAEWAMHDVEWTRDYQRAMALHESQMQEWLSASQLVVEAGEDVPDVGEVSPDGCV